MKENNKGSITVEAALAVPVFVLALAAIICFFRIILMQSELQSGMSEAAKELSIIGYVSSATNTDGQEDNIMPEVKFLANNIAVQAEITKYFDNQQEYSNFLFGDVSYNRSSYMEEDDVVDLIAEYTICNPFVKMVRMPTIQRLRTRAFVGTNTLLSLEDDSKKQDEEDEQFVYVTETGEVYHTSLSCSSLNLNISMCNLNEVVSKRNSSGGKYQPCEKCCENMDGVTIVYIGEDGDAYHTSLECSGLKRTIRKVPLSEVQEKMRACYRCGS